MLSAKPITLTANEFRTDDAAVTGHVGGVGPADREQLIKRGRPFRHIGVSIDRRIADIAHGLAREDHTIRTEERDMARLDNGHITRADQRSLNQQENAVSEQIYDLRH